ncbi:MAG: phenylalanine--tRNA ligase subunit beta [Deltaproteobacteria bacterium]|nr:phenylalanine--tRNA ligase subunit beta [Deltaproteobacteria bacterium]
MKISCRWLKEFLPALKASPRTIADRLTNTGLEVEAVEERGGGLEKVVVGEVVKVDRHPNADRLSLCAVTDGKKTHSVVCGAPNVTVNKKYPLALIGARLPNGMEIKQAKIRGVDSEGMLCSAKELGLKGDASGLLTLDDEAPAGKSFVVYYGLNDTILDVAVPPNRGDLLSHRGMAREVSAIFFLPFKDLKSPVLKGGYPIGDYVSVKVEDSAGCPRYCARVVRGVRIAPSPRRLQTRLELLGVRPVNNVVDAANYVMLETGHPLHAFDHRFIRGGVLKIRKAGESQTFETLDHENRSLLKDDLLIADSEGPVALAGIMGGKMSEVREDTETLVLEAASFHPGRIRSTARRLGIQSESSYRFERGVNPETVSLAIDRLTELIISLAGGEASGDRIDIYPKRVKATRLALHQAEIERTLGISIRQAEVKKILGRLGLAPSAVKGGFKVGAPSFRQDLTREIDLIEELVRFTGYDKIPSDLPRIAVRSPRQSPASAVESEVRAFFSAHGFFETIHYGFCDRQELEKARYEGPTVSLSNPLSQELSELCPTLLPALLGTYRKNRLKVSGPLKFFEIRPIFLPPSVEIRRLTAIYGGAAGPKNWQGLNRAMDFFDGKGILEALMAEGKINPVDFRTAEKNEFHPGQSVEILTGETCLGFFGKVHPEILRRYEIDDAVYAFDLDGAGLAGLWRKTTPAFRPLSPYPTVTRDLALVMDRSLSHDAILRVIQEAKVPALKEVFLFDVYEGEKLPAGKKSLAFSLVYENPERTLTDKEVNDAHFALVDVLAQKLGVVLR